MKQRYLTKRLLTNFLEDMRSREYSPGTIEKYWRNVVQFAKFLGSGSINRQAVSQWKDQLLSQGQKPETINGKLSAVELFLRFCGREDCIVPHFKIQRRLFREENRELTQEEYSRLLNTANRQGKVRLGLLLQTICSTGIRVSEVQYITVEAARQGCSEISLKGKIRTILLPQKLCRKLLQYAQKNKIAFGEIFITKSGKRLSRKQIWTEMKALCREAQVNPAKVFPHNLRHLFARTFYRINRNLVELSSILGHSSMETTRIYLLTTASEHKRQLEKLKLLC